MLGPYPTWFEMRKRGEPYAICVRNSWCSHMRVRDPLEVKFLIPFHDKLAAVTEKQKHIDTWREPYQAYYIPYKWRYPFIKWMTECVGPGDLPDPQKLQPPAPPLIDLDPFRTMFEVTPTI